MATTIDLDDGGVTSVDGSSITFPVRSGHHVAVTVTDTYGAAPPSPTTKPEPGPSVLPESASQGGLPATGAPAGLRWLTGLGVGLVFAGVGLLVASRRRPLIRTGRRS